MPWNERVFDRARGATGAQMLLATVVLATGAYAAHSSHDGVDFIKSIWAPVRGLLRGSNVYDPANTAYLHRYALSEPAALWTPTALLLHAPLAALGRTRAADAMTALDAALVWAGVLLLVRPRSPRTCLAAGLVGAMLILSATVQDSLSFGQLAPWAFVGVALLAVTLRRGGSPWWSAVGVALVSLKPQFAVPLFVALGLMGAWRVLVRAAGILLVTSLPGAFLFLSAAGSLSAALSTVGDNLKFFSHLGPDDLTNALNNRIDLLGVVSHLHGPTLNGLGWSLLLLVFLTGLVGPILRRPGRPSLRRDPALIGLLSLYVVISLYHQPYDQLLFFVAPLLALGAWAGGPGQRGERRAVVGGGAVLMLSELVLRAGFRGRMVAHGLSSHTVRAAYFTIPTLVAVATVVAAMGVTGTESERVVI